MKFFSSLLIAALFSTTSALAESVIPSGAQLQLRAEQATRMIDTTTLKQRLRDEPDLVLIDIRTKAEIERMGGAIDVPQNINIPRGWLEFRVQSTALDKDTPIVVYCGGGLRSPLAAKTLQDMGYTDVSNYSAGYYGWKAAAEK
ncbi:MAG: rhodanese-like domain-containing protein [Chromatiales bacterium]